MDKILTFYDENKAPVRILVVMAADAEYGDALKAMGITPEIIGVGPINAAMNMVSILKDLSAAGTLPNLIANIGSGGSRDLRHKEVYQASALTYRDMDASPFGFEKGHTPFSDLPARLPIDIRIPGVETATVSTGGHVMTSALYDVLEADAAEMEAYAVYSACLAFGLPMIKLVGISDGHEELTGKLEAWTDYLADIDVKLAQAMGKLEQALAEGALSRDSLLTLPETLRHRQAA